MLMITRAHASFSPKFLEPFFFPLEVEEHPPLPLSTKSNRTEAVSNQETFNIWEVRLRR